MSKIEILSDNHMATAASQENDRHQVNRENIYQSHGHFAEYSAEQTLEKKPWDWLTERYRPACVLCRCVVMKCAWRLESVNTGSEIGAPVYLGCILIIDPIQANVGGRGLINIDSYQNIGDHQDTATFTFRCPCLNGKRMTFTDTAGHRLDHSLSNSRGVFPSLKWSKSGSKSAVLIFWSVNVSRHDKMSVEILDLIHRHVSPVHRYYPSYLCQ